MLRDYRALPRTVWVLVFGTLVNRAGSFLMPFLTLYMTAELAFSAGVATLVLSAFGFGVIFASLLGGFLADSLGRKPVMVGSLFLTAVMLLLIRSFESPQGLAAFIFLFAVVSEAFRPAASAAIADLVPSRLRPQAFSLQYLAINLGFAVAAALGGWLAVRSWNWLFYGDALTCALFALLLLVLVPETSGRAQEEGEPVNRGSYKRVFANRTFVVFCLAATVLCLAFTQPLSTFPLHLEGLGFDAQAYGRIMAINGLMVVVLQIPITQLVAKLPRAPMVVLAALLNVAGFTTKAFVSSFGAIVLAVAIWTIGEIILASLQPSIVTDLAPAALRGRYLGVFGMTWAVAMVIATPLGGQLLERSGGQGLWLAAGATCLVAALLYASVWRGMARPRPVSAS